MQSERVAKAPLKGIVPRYVCIIKGERCEVGIQELARNPAIGRLRGSDNMLEVYTRCYHPQQMVNHGSGAGSYTTAAGVLADILDLQDLFS
ncbi:hypothetical protein MLD38_008183 [Melastoma candidum]|uniref:Uncharacterized protein n=1 Tax=Melastoma candidum TaxID=119954 RepID=A0ACB9RXU0_9MYRT|nr:hypothetical protein MLD38_008183 [Melastoma candidum]